MDEVLGTLSASPAAGLADHNQGSSSSRKIGEARTNVAGVTYEPDDRKRQVQYYP